LEDFENLANENLVNVTQSKRVTQIRKKNKPTNDEERFIQIRTSLEDLFITQMEDKMSIIDGEDDKRAMIKDLSGQKDRLFQLENSNESDLNTDIKQIKESLRESEVFIEKISADNIKLTQKLLENDKKIKFILDV
jgi:hypothetical protein